MKVKDCLLEFLTPKYSRLEFPGLDVEESVSYRCDKYAICVDTSEATAEDLIDATRKAYESILPYCKNCAKIRSGNRNMGNEQ